MRDSKKAFISTGIVLFLFVILSGLFMKFTFKYTHNFDWYLREELANKIDFLIAGASQGRCGFDTKQIDQITGSNSYNLCYDATENFEKHYLLNKELSRNDVKTVVLELSYDTLQLTGKSDYTDANIFSIMRLDSFSDRISYFIKNINLDNKLYVYSSLMCEGLDGIMSSRNLVEETQRELKGSLFQVAEDHSLAAEEVVSEYNRYKFSVDSFKEHTVKEFTELIKLCQKHGANVIVTVVPVSNNCLWGTENLDSFAKWTKDFCKKNNADYYDFNLLKNRYELFSDTDCFSTDTHHMSEKGSKVFTKIFANTIKEASQGKDVSRCFYESYEKMKQDSPYMSIYKEKTKK